MIAGFRCCIAFLPFVGMLVFRSGTQIKGMSSWYVFAALQGVQTQTAECSRTVPEKRSFSDIDKHALNSRWQQVVHQ